MGIEHDPTVVRQILHVDMDAFFASVEQRDDPTLRGRPVLVGGSLRRGVVCAASYEARPSGARSAMPMAEALRRCPDAVVVPPRHGRYADVSRKVFEIFQRFSPLVQGLSLDEAFIDVTESRALFGDGATIARAIKNAVHAELGLSASAGVAPCKFVAKVASDLRKPNALVVVCPDEVQSFLAPLPIERMWGVGPKTAPKLRELGYQTLGDLARARPTELERLLGTWGTQIQLLARGIDGRTVDPDTLSKSVGAEETYDEDLTDRASIERTLLDHAGRVAQRMVREGYSARTVVVKLKFADFTIRTRRVTLPEAVADTGSIYDAARGLLDGFALDRARVRLTGVSVAELIEGPPPRTLFPNVAAEKRRKLESLVADVADKFGGVGITRATLLARDRGTREE